MDEGPWRRLRPTLRELLGSDVIGVTPTTAGLTHASTGVVALENGASVFVKAGLDEHSGPQVLREISNLNLIEGGFVPEFIACVEDPPIIVLEDLSAGHWPEPYPEDLSGLEEALVALRNLPIPPDAGLPTLELPGPDLVDSLTEDATRGVSAAGTWVTRHQREIATAIESIGPADTLVHSDLWYPNICFLPDRVVLVDWSHLSIGPPGMDASTVSIDLIIEGRPPLDLPEPLGWAAVHIAWVVNALARGPSAEISDAEFWISDNQELFDGAAFWLSRQLDVEPPPQMSSRAVGWG